MCFATRTMQAPVGPKKKEQKDFVLSSIPETKAACLDLSLPVLVVSLCCQVFELIISLSFDSEKNRGRAGSCAFPILACTNAPTHPPPPSQKKKKKKKSKTK